MTTYSPSQSDRAPRIRMEAIGEAFQLVKAQAGVWMLAMLIMLAVTQGVALAAGKLLGGTVTGQEGSVAHAAQEVASVSATQLISFMVSAFFMGSMYRMALKQIRGGAIKISDLFSAGDILGSLIGGILLMMLTVYGGMILLIVPGLFASGMLMLMMPIIADRGVGPVEAFKLSWEIMRGKVLAGLGFSFVAGLVASLGLFLLGIGYLFTGPILYVATAIVYQDLFFGGRPEKTAASNTATAAVMSPSTFDR